MALRVVLCLFVVTGWVAACQSDVPEGPADPEPQTEPEPEQTEPVDPATLLEAPADGVQVTIGPFTVLPGEERTICAYMDVPTDEMRNIIRVETAMAVGSHHMNLYFAFSDLDKEGTMDCGGEQMTSLIVFGAQQPYHDVPMPPGIGFPLPAKQQMILEAHYINASTDPVEAIGAVNMHFAPPEAEIMVGGIMALFPDVIEVPAHGSAKVTSRCQITMEGEIFLMMSHMHKYGQYFEAYHVDTTTVPETRTLIYENDDWHKPEYTLLEPDQFLAIKPGDVIEFSCHYENETDRTVTMGPSGDTDEMCIFGTAYVPFHGILLCTQEEAICPEPVIREDVDPGTSQCARFGDCAFRCDAFDFDCMNCCAPAMTVECMFCTQGMLGCAIAAGCASGLSDFDISCVATECFEEFNECFGQPLPDQD